MPMQFGHEVDIDMVGKVRAHLCDIGAHVDTNRSEVVGWADARQHEEFRRTYGA